VPTADCFYSVFKELAFSDHVDTGDVGNRPTRGILSFFVRHCQPTELWSDKVVRNRKTLQGFRLADHPGYYSQARFSFTNPVE
jgi:hypothetical protein